MRFPLEVVEAVQGATWPADKPLFVRYSSKATDAAPELDGRGHHPVSLAALLKRLGVDVVDCSFWRY